MLRGRKGQVLWSLTRCPWSQGVHGFPSSSGGKASACNAGDPGLIPGSGRSPGEGNGNPLQYSCLENPIDRGAWRAIVHGVAKSWTLLSNTHTHTHTRTHTHTYTHTHVHTHTHTETKNGQLSFQTFEVHWALLLIHAANLTHTLCVQALCFSSAVS